MQSYAISNNLLNREFSVKWWDSLKIDPIINQINKDFPPPVHKAIAQKSRSQSSLESVSIVKKSSKELKDLAGQLLLQASQLEAEEKDSPTSSKASTSHQLINPFQDSQDPYEGHNLGNPQTILVARVSTQNNSKQFQIPTTVTIQNSTRQVTIHEWYQPTQDDKNNTCRHRRQNMNSGISKESYGTLASLNRPREASDLDWGGAQDPLETPEILGRGKLLFWG